MKCVRSVRNEYENQMFIYDYHPSSAPGTDWENKHEGYRGQPGATRSVVDVVCEVTVQIPPGLTAQLPGKLGPQASWFFFFGKDAIMMGTHDQFTSQVHRYGKSAIVVLVDGEKRVPQESRQQVLGTCLTLVVCPQRRGRPLTGRERLLGKHMGR